MENIHILPTDKPSRLYLEDNILKTNNEVYGHGNQFIYITDTEKFKKDEWITDGIEVIKASSKVVEAQGLVNRREWSKIVLTNDTSLIEDGIQAIDDEFLEWYVKNPSCEKVIVTNLYGDFNPVKYEYKIIIPKEEPKQETLEEAAEKWYDSTEENKGFPKIQAFKAGAKWQAERMYSEEEAGELVYNVIGEYAKHYGIMIDGLKLNELFEQFKKK